MMKKLSSFLIVSCLVAITNLLCGQDHLQSGNSNDPVEKEHLVNPHPNPPNPVPDPGSYSLDADQTPLVQNNGEQKKAPVNTGGKARSVNRAKAIKKPSTK